MTTIRCICASLIELGNDEVYYYTYAAQLDWNHFDHPPIVGILIRFFTLNLHWVNEFSMRLSAIVGAAVGTWIVGQIGLLIKNERTGFIAAILYNASIYSGIVAGLFILPDSPAVVFWLAGIYTFIKALREDLGPRQNRFLALTGLWIGLATMSKVHGCFLWFGILGYLITSQRNIFRSKGLYYGLLLTAVIVLPILIWNIQYDFITYRFHGDRVDVSGFNPNLKALGTAVLGQFLYYNPLIALLSATALLAWCRRQVFMDASTARLLLWLALPIITITTAIAIFKPILPHWSGPGFIPLLFVTAAWVDERLTLKEHLSRGRRIINSMLYLNMFVMIVGVILIRCYPGTLAAKEELRIGQGDFTLDMYGWKDFERQFAKIQAKEGKLPLMVDKWFIGGHLYYYVARPLDIPLVSYGALHDLHKFAWLMDKKNSLIPGESAYYVTPSNYFRDPNQLYSALFEEITLLAKIPETRSGKLTRYCYVYKLQRARTVIGTAITQ